MVFSICTALVDSKEAKFRSNDQDTSPSAGKITKVVFVPCCVWKCVPTAPTGCVNILKVCGCYLL